MNKTACVTSPVGPLRRHTAPRPSRSSETVAQRNFRGIGKSEEGKSKTWGALEVHDVYFAEGNKQTSKRADCIGSQPLSNAFVLMTSKPDKSRFNSGSFPHGWVSSNAQSALSS